MVRWAGLSRAVGTWLDRSEVRIQRQELRLPVVSSWAMHRWLLECANFFSSITLFVPHNCPTTSPFISPISLRIPSNCSSVILCFWNVPTFYQQSNISPFLCPIIVPTKLPYIGPYYLKFPHWSWVMHRWWTEMCQCFILNNPVFHSLFSLTLQKRDLFLKSKIRQR